MIRGMKWGRLCAVGVLGAALLVMPTASAQQVPDPDFPNLPNRQQTPSAISGAAFLTASYATNQSFIGPSKQWVELTDLKVAADVANMSVVRPADCEVIFGAGSPRCRNDEPGANGKTAIRALAYPVDFRGDDPASPPADRSELRRFGSRFTDFPVQRIRTVAFGSIPVEAQLHLSLSVDEGGLPYGIQLDADNFIFPREPGNPTIPQVITDSVGYGLLDLRLSNLVVDGTPVDVGESCELAQPAQLRLEGRGYRGRLTPVPEGRYNPALGGVLQGELRVGVFQDCGTGGDDLSPLVNAMAARSDVPVRVEQALVTNPCFTNPARQAVEEARCNRPAEQPFPEGEDLPVFPPTDFPPPPVD